MSNSLYKMTTSKCIPAGADIIMALDDVVSSVNTSPERCCIYQIRAYMFLTGINGLSNPFPD